MQTEQQAAPMGDPDERHDGDRSVGLKWNVGEPTEEGQPQARLHVMYFKDAGYVAWLDIVQTDGVFERSYPFGPQEKILTVPASRFGRSAFERATDSALDQLRHRFENGDRVVRAYFDPAVIARFDGTPQSIQV
ncbi:hypothetical protein SUDANB95_07865 (plasmid) [Actinosynnema sp. ALI-1.44]